MDVAGRTSLEVLRRADAPIFLTPSEELAEAARSASSYLFSALKPYTSNCPITELITEGFDAEQIWAQIETQSEPLIKTLRSQLRKLEKNPEELEKQFNLFRINVVDGNNEEKEELVEEDDKEMDGSDEEEVKEDGKINEDEDDDDEEDEEDEDEDEGEDEGEEEEGDGLRDVEDKFLKIKELERYLEEDEAREYGIEKENKMKRKRKGKDEDEDENDDEDESDDEEDEESEEDEDEIGLMEMNDIEDDGTGAAKYDDFFGGKKKSKQKKTSKPLERSDDSDMEGSDDPDPDERPKKVDIVEKKNLSTYEREQEKLRSQIEDMERANMEPKEWMMQGEITAGKRAKNSALEVDLDFEHNVRPAPVITEEVTASLEELIQKRILEGRFNDVQKPPTLLNKAPKERIEMDENKSKKGLAEIYESEYVQKTGLVATAMSFSDEQKKEASTLFKRLCLKLDALSHFHFTPKPAIEDMSIQTNVPALAMEEIAPLAVSDAAMLAPEEVFSGKGDIKEQTELTQDERKRRRAKKKRKFKAESVKRVAGKPEQDTTTKAAEGNEAS